MERETVFEASELEWPVGSFPYEAEFNGLGKAVASSKKFDREGDLIAVYYTLQSDPKVVITVFND